MRRSAAMLYALFVVLFAVLAVVPSDGAAFEVLLGGCFIAVQLIGLFACIRAARLPRLSEADRRPWRWLTAWFVLQLVSGAAMTVANPATRGFGDILSASMVLVLGCRVLAVPVLVRALTAFLTEPLSRGARGKLCLDVMIVVGAAVMVIWYLVVGPGLYEAGRTAATGRLFIAVLPATDAVLLLTVLTVLMHGTVTSARRSLLLLLVGHAGNLANDLWLTYLVVFRAGQELPRLQILVTLLSLGLVAAAAVERGRRTDERNAGYRQRLRPYTTLPYVALAGGYALLVLAAAKADVYPWAGLVGGALIMTTGVAGRQLVSLRENHRLVVTDSLTGLANRLLFDEHLAGGLNRVRNLGPGRHRSVAVLHIDLDGFKQVNDTFGHEAGDRVLAAFGEMLAHCVRRTDTAARLGGDEFGVVLLDLADQQDAIDVARRLLEHLQANPITLGGVPRPIRCSIGVAFYDPSASEPFEPDPSEPTPRMTPDTLTNRADQAMYLAKRGGPAHWAVWNERLANAVVPPQRRHADAQETSRLETT